MSGRKAACEEGGPEGWQQHWLKAMACSGCWDEPALSGLAASTACACLTPHAAACPADYAGAAPYSEQLLAEVLQELRCVPAGVGEGPSGAAGPLLGRDQQHKVAACS